MVIIMIIIPCLFTLKFRVLLAHEVADLHAKPGRKQEQWKLNSMSNFRYAYCLIWLGRDGIT